LKIKEEFTMIINHNLNAMNAHRNMSINTANSGKSMEKLSSGLRINKAGDDAAGLAISEKMRGQIRGLDQASRNSQDAISMIQTAEGALNETHSILQRMRELAVQSSNDTNNSDDRSALNKEVTELKNEINRIASQTEFNTQKLLDGTLGAKVDKSTTNSDVLAVAGVIDAQVSGGLKAGDWTITKGDGTSVATGAYSITNGTTTLTSNVAANATAGTITFGNGELTISVNDAYATDALDGKKIKITGTENKFQIGANNGQTMRLSISDMSITGLDANVTVDTQANAQTALTKLDAAIKKVSDERAKLGANQNRLEHTIANLGTSSENLTAAESRIRDVDMAKEMMNFSKNNILSQAAQAMISQANQQPQGVLQLLR
jgi:flagellin